jgi:putative Ca2+/H+ antiporter (TMEM165/GDT1 family)
MDKVVILFRFLNGLNFQELVTPSLTSFLLVFAAEIGDKSQLVCMTLAARHRALPVIFGSILAFVFLNTLAVVFGVAMANWLPEYIVSGVVAILFFIFGIQALLTDTDNADDTVVEKSSGSLFVTTFLLISIAEFGDKTQLAVVGLSSTQIPLAVWIGATAALVLTSILGCIAGTTFLKRLPLIYLHKTSGIFFICLAIFAIHHTFMTLMQNNNFLILKVIFH